MRLPAEESASGSRFPFALVCSAALVLLVYKAVTILASAPLRVGASWLLECSLLVVLCASWSFAQRARERLGAGFTALASVLFYALVELQLVLVISHTYFFESAAERRFSPLELDWHAVRYFFANVLPPAGALTIAALLAVIHALAYALARRERLTPPRHLGSLALALTVGLSLLKPPLPSPLADLSGDIAERLMTAPLAVASSEPSRYTPRALDQSQIPPLGPRRWDKVLVFVMETMTRQQFELEAATLPETTFARSGRAHAHEYRAYFATNQDSRTGMLSMLSSRFIPYEAYTEYGRDHYMKLGQRSSLIDAMRERGYRSAFAVSQEEVELVVGDLKWDEVINLDERAREGADGKLCFVPYEFEHSCEDMVLLPRVLRFLDRDEPVFLYQEFVWGHASEYNQASGRTNTDYYSAYLDAVIAHLRQTGALERTLIVLTSDHGVREKPVQTDREMYHLPMWFYAPSFEASQDDRLFSHLDFKDLLLAHAFASAPEPQPSPFVLVIGPTGTSFLTVLTEPGQLLLLKSRGSSRYLIHAQGYADGASRTRAASEFSRLFGEYLGYFERL